MASSTRRTAPKTAPKTRVAKTAPKGAKTAKTSAKGATRAKGAKTAPASAATRGPSAETIAFAKRVVELRDSKGLAWKEVAAKLGVNYDHNGSSRLRRAYTLGEGATVGARAKGSAK